MLKNKELYNLIRSVMWDASKTFELHNPGGEFISSYKLYNNCKPPVDWFEVATKCSNNPNHEHFGKTPEAILEIWQSKKFKGQERGNNVDDYITSILEGKEYIIPDPTDTSFINKMKSIDDFNEKVLSRIYRYVGSEVWMTSPSLGLRVKCDALFELANKSLLVCEWKNIEKYTTYNRFNKLHGPLTGYDDCDLVQNNLQTYIYKYILEENGFDNVNVLIVNFEEDQHRPIDLIFKDNYKELIEELVNYYRVG